MTDQAEIRPTGSSRLWLLLPFGLFFALSALFYERLTDGGNPAVIPSALINKPVPDFAMPALEGLTDDNGPVPGFSNADLKGDVTLVNVWGSWCGPCRAEHPYLMALAERDDIRIFGINQKDKPANARRFLGSLGNPYEAVGVDPRGRVSIDWGVYGVPETFVVNAQGCITHKHVGPLTDELVQTKLLPAVEAARASTEPCAAS